MNRIGLSYVINIGILVIAGWGFVEYFHIITELANIIRTEKQTWTVTMNITPIALMLIIGIGIIIGYKVQKKKYKKLSFWTFPLLFPSEDEREEILTAKACRTTLLSLWCILPIAAATLVAYPLFNRNIPEYPLYVIFIILLIQTTIFHISLYRNKVV
ncbi:DUF2178 domain-containing protein [Bacillus multifaciens]|uniref:DUF2178 domain-containing protein n=1 Tax=Bacillus multifaciens TaxID=3068506 RepID=UPI00274228FF|nr:DUF2178 domain-containing protein [Bacillus sp. WLY-B-L8]MDP7979744.1 DUF2178 domain-containing protein [Bacillus sp. WLY-B-L8]